MKREAKLKPNLEVMALMERAVSLAEKRADRAKEAISLLQKATQKDSFCARAYFYGAALKLAVGDQEGALADLRAIDQVNPEYLPFYRDLRVPSPDKFPTLLPSLDRALRKDPACAWGYVLKSFLLKAVLRHEKTKAPMDLAVQCEPRSAALWALRSRVRLTNRPELYDGLADIRHAVSLNPQCGWLHCWKGEGLRRRGNFKKALAAFNRGLTLDPFYKLGYAWRGGVRVVLGDYAKAVVDLTRSLKSDPIYDYDIDYTARSDQRSWAYNQRMLAWRGLRDIPKAIADLNRAHALSPRYGWIYNPKQEAIVFHTMIGELDTFLKKRPRFAWAYAWRGWSQEKRHDFSSALVNFERCLKINSRLAWPWVWSAHIFYVSNEIGLARKSLKRAMSLDRHYSPAWGLKGRIERKLGNLEQAVVDFTKAIELDYRCSWALSERGNCLSLMGRSALAREDSRKAVGFYPAGRESSPVKWAQERAVVLA